VRLLVDSAADRTVLTYAVQADLQLPTVPPPPGLSFQGVGGTTPFIVVKTTLQFARTDGGPARFQGEFAVFTNPNALDMSILGRDVLNHLDVILSRRRNEVLLMAPPHQYTVSPS
jgi:hypothetical protein